MKLATFLPLLLLLVACGKDPAPALSPQVAVVCSTFAACEKDCHTKYDSCQSNPLCMVRLQECLGGMVVPCQGGVCYSASH